jgi:hypothetical protein
MVVHMSNPVLIDLLEDVKWIFVFLYIACTIGVTIGVHWENDKFPKEKQQRGHSLLIWSLIGDTLFTILIFATDGWVSQIQGSEIIALETILAPRFLTDAQISMIADTLRPFEGTVFHVVTYPTDPEPSALAGKIASALKGAGWERIPLEDSLFGVTAGVIVSPNNSICESSGRCTQGTVSEADQMAAQALVMALKKAGLSAVLSPGSLVVNPKRIAVQIAVGKKP